jgi:uncharacterized protein YerC
MVRINRHEMTKKDLDRLFLQFDKILGRLDSRSTNTFLNELLGREERITLAKRFAAIVLIIEGSSEYRTARALKLSPTTAGKIASEIERGAYTGVIKLLKKNKRDYLKIIETIDSILHLGGILPHRVGIDRYHFLKKP